MGTAPWWDKIRWVAELRRQLRWRREQRQQQRYLVDPYRPLLPIKSLLIFLGIFAVYVLVAIGIVVGFDL